MTSIVENAVPKIASFNDEGLHYNLVANAIYEANRRIESPFDKSFIPYIIAGLTSFDMGRMMGARKYSLDNGCFASRLCAKVEQIRPPLERLVSLNLLSIDLQKYGDEVRQAYRVLSISGPGALHQDQTKSFHVGATKIMHFISPELFIMVDRYAAMAFRTACQLPFSNTTQPGYSADLYVECMKRAKADILEYGANKFRKLEPNTPVTRIYDKLTFVTGSTPNPP